MREQEEHDLAEGRSSKAYFEGMLALREEARHELALVFGVEDDAVALTDSTTRGCAIVLAGLGLSGEDEVITTDQEHFGLTGPLYATGARVVIVEGDEEAMAAAVTPRTKLIATSQVLWTNGRGSTCSVCARTRASRSSSTARSRRVRSRCRWARSTSTPSGQKWSCGPESTGGLYVADPERLRVKSPSYMSQDSYEPSGAFVPRERTKRFDSGWIPVPAMRGLLAALRGIPRIATSAPPRCPPAAVSCSRRMSTS